MGNAQVSIITLTYSSKKKKHPENMKISYRNAEKNLNAWFGSSVFWETRCHFRLTQSWVITGHINVGCCKTGDEQRLLKWLGADWSTQNVT